MNYFKLSRIAAALVLIASSGLAHATEWFVSPLGSDTTGNGSLAAPYKTLGHVLNPERAGAER